MNLRKIIKNLIDKFVKKLENWHFSLAQRLTIPIRRADCLTPPFRPSKGDMRNYEEILMKVITKECFLLLGSPPELENLVNRMEIKPIVVDSHSFLEKVLRIDYFDVIMGDLVLDRIESELQKNFLLKISKLLKSGGFFICRLHFTGKDLDSLLTDYFIMRDFRLAGDYQDYKFYPIYVLQKR